MNLKADQIERIKELGYTEAEARFIYIVAIHSGYFTLRQFLNFTQAKRGKRSNAFAQKLLNHGHATMRNYMGAGSVFHLFSRTIYGQIERDNLRNRRQHSFDFICTRLVLLDFILNNQDLAYFETEQDKVSFFWWSRGVARWFRWGLSVADPFVCRCLTSSAMLPFLHPAHRTGRADLPHPALGEDSRNGQSHCL